MKKVQFFLLVESILIAMGLITILSNSLFNFILIVVILLLTLRYYNQDNKSNFILTFGLLLLFLILMLNPYIIMAIILCIMYIVINYFSQVKKKNKYALIELKKELDIITHKNQWFGTNYYESNQFAFDDINIIRLTGNDIINLTNVIISDEINHIIIQKIYGPTKIIVPIDVVVKLDVSTIYGSVRCLDFAEYDLRNESIKLREETGDAIKVVKIVVNVLVGDVEVEKQ